MEFEEVATHFGYSLGAGAIPVKKFAYADKRRDGRKVRRDVVVPLAASAISPRSYQKLVAKIEGKPEERILSYLMLRSLKQARYSAQNTGHFALAASTYTHFTSPIRRYPDLIVHRITKALLREGVEGRGVIAAGRHSSPWTHTNEGSAISPMACAARARRSGSGSLSERRRSPAARGVRTRPMTSSAEMRAGFGSSS